MFVILYPLFLKGKKHICHVYIFMLINWFFWAYSLIISLNIWRKGLDFHLKVKMSHLIAVYSKIQSNTRQDWINIERDTSRMIFVNLTEKRVLAKRQKHIRYGGEHAKTVGNFTVKWKHSSTATSLKYQAVLLKEYYHV